MTKFLRETGLGGEFSLGDNPYSKLVCDECGQVMVVMVRTNHRAHARRLREHLASHRQPRVI